MSRIKGTCYHAILNSSLIAFHSQRELSRKLGLRLGSVNYVVSNLVDAGLIKAKRVKQEEGTN